jgi:chemotaxis protein methyltransferase CheR
LPWSSPSTPAPTGIPLSDTGNGHFDGRAREGEAGVFTSAVAGPVPPELWRRYFMRSRDRSSDLLRVVPELRETVEFRRVNLMEEFGLADPVDAIFCRNVIIYFDRPTQQRLFQKFARQLVDGGTMFIGHSESLSSLNVPFAPLGPAMYRKSDAR